MTARQRMRRLFADSTAGSAIEFGLLAPAMITMLMGVMWVGIQMKAYNELRSVTADVSRYTVIEYQKSNKLTAAQISDVAAATAVRPPYALIGDNLDVNVTEPTSPVTNTRKLVIQLSYTAPSLLQFAGVGSPTLSFSQTIYVPA
ncbi:pilus assembly protein [Novosphingobium sp. G106]|uniref:TadE/TadG family type IV pilus assembly protein n=1 Tax=Novosphingobium sp. G106 TaxID=2849500 RepID=UPI001C2CCC8E|nr:TadE/TadG family type IV pilus assembly protein [Novosphingobium sp. G106]MBV1689359.1 pilus assembly protein [Novosphingobium sp. G106]